MNPPTAQSPGAAHEMAKTATDGAAAATRIARVHAPCASLATNAWSLLDESWSLSARAHFPGAGQDRDRKFASMKKLLAGNTASLPSPGIRAASPHPVRDWLDTKTPKVPALFLYIPPALHLPDSGQETDATIASPPAFSEPVPGTFSACRQWPFTSLTTNAWT